MESPIKSLDEALEQIEVDGEGAEEEHAVVEEEIETTPPEDPAKKLPVVVSSNAEYEGSIPLTMGTYLENLKPGRFYVEGYGMVTKEEFPVPLGFPMHVHGTLVRRFTIVNNKQMIVQVITYGAAIHAIKTPDKHGILEDVVLGFDYLKGYEKDNHYFGGTIGRFAGIIANATVKIGREEFFLTNNLGEHHSHGGDMGFDKVVWDDYVEGNKIVMSYVSCHNEEGFPGDIMVQVSYELTDKNVLICETKAVSSLTSPINITNHSYFNLAGHGAGPTELNKHLLMVNADKYMPTDGGTLTTGRLRNVGASVFDLRIPRRLEKALEKVPGGGYDHTFCITRGYDRESVTFAARLVHPETGRFMEVETNQPGIHIYTGQRLPDPDTPIFPEPESAEEVADENEKPPSDAELEGEGKEEGDGFASMHELTEDIKNTEEVKEKGDGIPFVEGTLNEMDNQDELNDLDNGNEFNEEMFEEVDGEGEEEEAIPEFTYPEEIYGKMGFGYRKHGGICLMPMNFPDALAHKSFPDTMLNPGQLYHKITSYKFGIIPQKKPPNLSLTIGEEIPTDQVDDTAGRSGDNSDAGVNGSEDRIRRSDVKSDAAVNESV